MRLGSEKAQYRGGAWHNATVVSSTPDSIQISWKYDGSLDEARGFDNEVFSKPLWLWLVYTIVLIFFYFSSSVCFNSYILISSDFLGFCLTWLGCFSAQIRLLEISLTTFTKDDLQWGIFGTFEMDPTDIFAPIYLCPIAKAIIASLLPLLRWNQIKWGKKGNPVHVLLGWGAFERKCWRVFVSFFTSPKCGNVIKIYKNPEIVSVNRISFPKESLPQQSCGILEFSAMAR